MAGANVAASLALTLGVGVVTTLAVTGIFVAPAVIDCSHRGGAVAACLMAKLDSALHKPTVTTAAPTVTAASSQAAAPTVSAQPVAPQPVVAGWMDAYANEPPAPDVSVAVLAGPSGRLDATAVVPRTPEASLAELAAMPGTIDAHWIEPTSPDVGVAELSGSLGTIDGDALIPPRPQAPIAIVSGPSGTLDTGGIAPATPVAHSMAELAAPAGTLDAGGGNLPARQEVQVAALEPGGELFTAGSPQSQPAPGAGLAELTPAPRGTLDATGALGNPPTTVTVALLAPQGTITAGGLLPRRPPAATAVTLQPSQGELSANVIALPRARPLVAELTLGPGRLDAAGTTGAPQGNGALAALEAAVQPAPKVPPPIDSPSYTRLDGPPPIQPSVVLLGRITPPAARVLAPGRSPSVETLAAPRRGRASSFATLQVH